MMGSSRKISAQVVLKAASGKKIEPSTLITSENVAEYVPSADAIDRVSKELKAKGFEVGKCVGNSFSIAGPIRLFETFFRHEIDESEDKVRFAKSGYELPKEKIPAAIGQYVAHITFTAPPDFGPGNMSTLE